jgi:DNA (cytosine-5)-methyltransferase 1
LAAYGHRFPIKHTSPPCQGYTIATAGNLAARSKYQRLIPATRELLKVTGGVWIIENVEQARSQMVTPVMLCGRMFDLATEDVDGLPLVLDRHRLFESNVPLETPFHSTHGREQVAGVYGGSRRAKRQEGETLAEVAPRDRYAARYERGGGYVPRSKQVQQALLGIDWMTVKGMQESIPPAYTEYLGRQLLAASSVLQGLDLASA